MSEYQRYEIGCGGCSVITREEAIDRAAEVFARARAERDRLSPRAAAEAAWYIGHPLKTVEAIEARIVEYRARAERLAESASQLSGQPATDPAA